MDSMEQVYRQHAQMVYRYLIAQTNDPQLAEELTQETFYQAVRSCERYDGSCKVSTWLCAIAKNVLLNYNRKNKPLYTPDYEEVLSQETSPGAESVVLDRMSKMELLRKLHSLPEPTREVMYLRLSGELSFREIGEILERSENWARVTYYRGKEKLIREDR
ncbi:MAG: sigma-70 family RNA polymerase sigma factor [Oscillospiraceae bacterium]|nr:sigma-70 family RNA polymerase sigma factor [Oscillospiraceae bacterium]